MPVAGQHKVAGDPPGVYVTKPSHAAAPRPTEAELEILNVLWAHGGGTVREVHEALYREDGGGYTTALKMMQVMHAKGLVERHQGSPLSTGTGF